MGKKSRRNKGGRGRGNQNAPNTGTTDAAVWRQAATMTTNLRASQLVEEAKGWKIPNPPDIDSVVLSSSEAILLEKFVKVLIEKNAVPTALLDEVILTRRLKEIWFCNPELQWFSFPVINAVLNNDFNKERITLGETPYPIIIMFSQWKMLHRQFGYMGGDEMVEIALRMGADPKSQLPNKVNSIFMAVKYGTAKTVELLLDAGCDIHAKDCFGRTCLYNATERSDPSIVSKILDHLPSTETFSSDLMQGGTTLLTAPDRILNSYDSGNVAFDPTTSRMVIGLPISWKVLGKPNVADLCHTLILLRRKGAEFSPDNLAMIGYFLSGQAISPELNAFAFEEDMRSLVRSIMGLWLPPAIQHELLALKTNNNLSISENIEEDGIRYECPICLENINDEKRKKVVTLYCGHTFCWKCIYDYGHADNISNSPKLCPLCRKLLCREVCSRPKSEVGDLMYGNNRENQHKWGSKLLTDEQVKIECAARKISTLNLNDDSLRDNLNLFDVKTQHIALNLGASKSIMTNTSGFIAPKYGRVAIPITLKGVPILAYVSSKSPFTVASKVFVETFGLRRKNLTSKKFRNFDGSKLKSKDITALDEFELVVGDICIKINSAIEASASHDFMGLQLGWDFFCSLAYCTFDAEIDAEGNETVFMRSDVFGGALIVEPPEREEIRLYARNGKSCAMPLLHVNPDTPDIISDTTVSFKKNQTFVECYWCCRMFPEDMLMCSDCSDKDPAYYCDKDCQQKAFFVHRRFCPRS